MLELFGPDIERGLGLDLSHDMLALARARLDRAGLRHCSVRQGDIYDLALPRDSFDVIIIHQVLHFLDDAQRAIAAAARVLRPGGRLLVVDFAPHDLEFLRDEHAHRRLGFAPETVTQWFDAAGLEFVAQKTLPPEQNSDGKIAVSLWLGRDPRIVLADPAPAPSARGRLMNTPTRPSRFVQAGNERRIRVSFEFFPPKSEEMEKTLWDFDHPARAAQAELRLGDLRRRRLYPRAHACDGETHPRRDRADAGSASDLRRRDLR